MRFTYDQLIASGQSVFDAMGAKVPSVRWAEYVDGGVKVSVVIRPEKTGANAVAPLVGKSDGEIYIAEFEGIILGGAIGPSK
jgi:hypothetical protein